MAGSLAHTHHLPCQGQTRHILANAVIPTGHNRRCYGLHQKQPTGRIQVQQGAPVARRRDYSLACKSAGSAGRQNSHPQGKEDHETLTESQQALNDFVSWLVANGVQGVGLEDSPAGLYEDGEGDRVERGLLALRKIKSGEPVLCVPLRLALTDHSQDQEANGLLYKGAPWSVRLSTKLLREIGKGPASPWWPYLKVLPAKVPAPLEAFSWEDMQLVEWPPAQAAIYEYNWLVSDSYSRAAGIGPDPEQLQAIQQLIASQNQDVNTDTWVVPEQDRLGSPAPSSDTIQQVLGGADSQTFQWAMSVVHSRTFANAAPQGGVGVRMLVPLVDMLNHAGDITASGMMDDINIRPQDNVRWDVVSPASSPAGCWEMVVSATTDIPAGSQLLLSYGDRASDDYFLYYGFVPPLCNPHEDALLFEDLEEALEWHHNKYGDKLSSEEAERVYMEAYTAALTEHKSARTPPGQNKTSSNDSSKSSNSNSHSKSSQQQQAQQGNSGPQLPKGWQQLKVYAGGKVDAAIILAFHLASQQQPSDPDNDINDSTDQSQNPTPAAEIAIGQRAAELLQSMATPLLIDLFLLYEDTVRRRSSDVDVVAKLLLRQAREQHQYHATLNQLLQPQIGDDNQSADNQVINHAFPDIPDASRKAALPEILPALTSIAEKLRSNGSLQLKAPLTANQLLIVQFRVAKKLVLWGVVAGACQVLENGSQSEAKPLDMHIVSTRQLDVPRL